MGHYRIRGSRELEALSNHLTRRFKSPSGFSLVMPALLGPLEEIHLPVRDLAKMRDFYTRLLAFPVVFEHAGRMVALATRGATLLLDAEKPPGGPVYLGFRAKDSARILGRLEEAGVPTLARPREGHWGELLSAFRDPEGNVLHLEERTSQSTRAHRH